MTKLGKRLEAIASFVDSEAVVADVGADHGKLLLYLAEQGKISLGYGIENKSGPYQILQSNLNECISARLVPIFQDGISVLSDDVDTLVLAGLGGETIISILRNGLDNLANVKTIITDSHTSIGEVRRYLTQIGYSIGDEKLVNDKNKFYEIIRFVKGKEKHSYSDFEYRHGPIIIKSPEFKNHAKRLIHKINILLKKDLPDNIKAKMIEEKEVLKRYEN